MCCWMQFSQCQASSQRGCCSSTALQHVRITTSELSDRSWPTRLPSITPETLAMSVHHHGHSRGQVRSGDQSHGQLASLSLSLILWHGLEERTTNQSGSVLGQLVRLFANDSCEAPCSGQFATLGRRFFQMPPSDRALIRS